MEREIYMCKREKSNIGRKRERDRTKKKYLTLLSANYVTAVERVKHIL